MKKIITILGAFMLLASSCDQATTTQVVANTESISTAVENADSVEAENGNVDWSADPMLTPRCFSYLDELHKSEIQLYGIEKIDSITFFASKNNTDIRRLELEIITDLELIKEILGNRVTWRACDGEVSRSGRPMWEGFVTEISFRTGETDSVFNAVYGMGGLWVTAYFPQFDVLRGEAGDMAVFHTVDLTTGATTRNVGNPATYVFSPSKRFRLNTFDSGHDFEVSFIQEKIDGQYQTTIDLFCEFQRRLGEFLSWVDTRNSFWKNDTILYITRIVEFCYPREYSRVSYYRIILK